MERKNGLPIGSNPYKATYNSRPMGSRIEYNYAKQNMSNFLSERVKNVVNHRLDNPESKQTLREDRLYADCLSSMPMCFNLFGLISDNMEKATNVVKEW